MTLPTELFPATTPQNLLAFQFSAWYPKFASTTMRSKIISPLLPAFLEYLHSDGVFVPEGSENLISSGDDHDDQSSDNDDARPRYAFPELDAQIRTTVEEYGAVFPKLNFSAPRDAAWVLPAGSPLKCVAPADVYLLLKSSDFAAHDLDPVHVFEGCHHGEGEPSPEYPMELVLRKWYAFDPSREFRCFVRAGILIGISQRDENHYVFLNDKETQDKIVNTMQSFWESKIKHLWDATLDYTFDVLLTRSLDSLHIVDFNPYMPRTDALLWSYEELLDVLKSRSSSPEEQLADHKPELRVISSKAHPAANRVAPTHQHNMLPREALELSSGRDIAEFAKVWHEQLAQAAIDSDED